MCLYCVENSYQNICVEICVFKGLEYLLIKNERTEAGEIVLLYAVNTLRCYTSYTVHWKKLQKNEKENMRKGC